MKIKIISKTDIISVENELNKWIEENPHIQIIQVYPYTVMLRDYFYGRPDEVCNQWSEFHWTIIYTERN